MFQNRERNVGKQMKTRIPTTGQHERMDKVDSYHAVFHACIKCN